jgi:branched-chain amino acid transport system permease protein
MDWLDLFNDGTRAAVGATAAAFALSAIGLNIQFGYAGLLNFGHVGFMLMGAYGTAITVDAGGSLWLGVLVGLGAGGVLALALGIPTLRLRADYLAIVTISAAEILRITARSTFAAPLTKGVFGIQQFAGDYLDNNPIADGSYGFGDFRFDERQLWVMTAAWFLVLLSAIFTWKIVRSPWGRVVRAIREDEDAARSLGKNVFGYKIQALVLGGSFGALAGVVLAVDQQNVNPDTYMPLLTFYAFTIVILGGPGTVLGPIVGAAVFWFLFEFVGEFMFSALELGWLPGFIDTTDVGPIRFGLVGLGLALLMVYRPQGVFGKREEMLLDAH